ncbi:MAG: peptidoglycan-associated lipoprotein Pal [Deltaproteobacteria bacterium]|nr:peptidoglycan-associated lipoprotein Pal [Deltaproteobacteria bacterium]MBW1923597.1 peptidoglycan-associated lipoprotein Pal [Deltaproteobacteria bacterium]MBW1948688.1 peptidoglycan-associated lipoprotein Pal [Deltaproteobacteria bacterium]MBW2006857.1 peptidoglycan-associated lipoprotein Pal [Deltaproteobacteria bacterium]MBW2101112.1 peptidoglycan-associated lipoprotein Pal [Deltaproteobacteria bacterium]
MPRKLMTIGIALVFACTSLVLVVSCAKKQVQVEERVQPTTEQAKVTETVQQEKEAVETKETKQVDTAKEEAYRRAEAERQARLRELERQQRLAFQIREFEAENIYFDFDKSDLKPEAQVVLKKKAEWLRNNPAYKLRIEGHCDERGTNEYNLALGERRAHSARNFLIALGISGDRIATISYGEERPVDPGHNEAAWAKNRRDEFKLIKK